MIRAVQRIMLVASLFAMSASGCGQSHSPPSQNTSPVKKDEAQQNEKTDGKLTISKETTYVTGPLKKDGTVDYVAAMDERFREGVTPENNAAVLFWQAVGPGEISVEEREKYFQMLGILPLPEKGDYFVNIRDFLNRSTVESKSEKEESDSKDQEIFWHILDPVKERPWSKEEFPTFAQWLAANEKSLDLIVEASKRPRRYDPMALYGERNLVVAVPIFYTEYYLFPGDIADALTARAMLRLNERKLDEAWADLLTCHRLARLIGQGPTTIDALNAGRVESKACKGDLALLENAHLTAAQALKMRQDLERLPAMPRYAEKVEIDERFGYLDMLSMTYREGISGLGAFLSQEKYKSLKNTVNLLVHYRKETPVDWDACFKLGNAWFDRMGDAYRKPTRAEQRQALKKIQEELSKMKETAADTISLEKAMSDNPRKALSERLGQVLFIVCGTAHMIPSYIHAEDEDTMRLEMDEVAFSLAAYHADHSSYPLKLGDLVPKYIAVVPKDVCNNSELHYGREGDGYVLYSVGRNGRDDGGKNYDDRDQSKDFEELVKNKEDYDDLVVRVPAPMAKKKEPLPAKEPTEKLSAADSLMQDSLGKRIQQSAKGLEYSDKVAEDLSQMALGWEDRHASGNISLLSLNKELNPAKQDYENQKIGKAEMAKVEKDVIEKLVTMLRFKIFPNNKCSTLEDVVKDREANCLGYSQLFYVLGNALGLSVKVIWVEEMFSDSPLKDKLHAACVVDLADGDMMMVDLTLNSVSDPFVLADKYSEVGSYLELKDKKNILGLHPIIQILDKNGVIGCIYFNKMEAVIKSKKYIQAFIGYSKVIELNPKLAEAYCNRANAYIGVGFYSYAINDCNKAIELKPKLVEAYIARGDAYARSGKRDQAIADFNKAIEINPNTGKAFLVKGILNGMNNKKEEAKKDLHKAVELDPNLEDNVKWATEQYQVDK